MVSEEVPVRAIVVEVEYEPVVGEVIEEIGLVASKVTFVFVTVVAVLPAKSVALKAKV